MAGGDNKWNDWLISFVIVIENERDDQASPGILGSSSPAVNG